MIPLLIAELGKNCTGNIFITLKKDSTYKADKKKKKNGNQQTREIKRGNQQTREIKRGAHNSNSRARTYSQALPLKAESTSKTMHVKKIQLHFSSDLLVQKH